jgi:hypothetical protein
MTPEEIEQLKTHLGQQQQPSLAKDIDGIIEIGRAHFGAAGFDEASQVVAETLGDKTNSLMDTLRQFDRPHEVIAHLSNNESQLKALAKLNPARQAIEIARIEAQMASNGHVNTGADPLWKTPAVRSGRVSDEDWSRSFGEGLSEKQFDREFWRRQDARNSRRR